MKRPVIKHFKNGTKVTFECNDQKKRAAFEEGVKQVLKSKAVGCNEDAIVSRLDDPLPSCAPDEPC